MKRFPKTLISIEGIKRLVDQYFIYVEGKSHLEIPADNSQHQTKVYDRHPQPPTFTGLALFMGFSSRQQFEDYALNGKFGQAIQYGKLRIEAEYEKKLHQPSPTGAIFALKNLGWNEKVDGTTTPGTTPATLDINVHETGPRPAASEKEVVMEEND